MCRDTVTDVFLFSRICCRGEYRAVCCLDKDIAVLVDSCVLKSVELTYLASLLNAEEVLVGTYASFRTHVNI